MEKMQDYLDLLTTIICLTKGTCESKEEKVQYYSIPNEQQILLSQERCHYINMLSIALDIINNLKNYNSTPTIAADK